MYLKLILEMMKKSTTKKLMICNMFFALKYNFKTRKQKYKFIYRDVCARKHTYIHKYIIVFLIYVSLGYYTMCSIFKNKLSFLKFSLPSYHIYEKERKRSPL